MDQEHALLAHSFLQWVPEHMRDLQLFELMVTAGVLSFLGMMAVILLILTFRSGRSIHIVVEGHSTMATHSNDVRAVVENYITDALEDAVFDGKLSRKHADYYYHQLGTFADLPGLLKKRKGIFKGKLHPYKAKQLREEIRGRLGNGVYKVRPTLPDARVEAPAKPQTNGSKTPTNRLAEIIRANPKL
jgi:hypothetical protein